MHEEEEAVRCTASLVFITIFNQTVFMFSFFGKKELESKVIDRVFVSSAAKQNAIIVNVRDQKRLVMVTWFEESYSQVQDLLQSNNLEADIYLAREVAAHNIQNSMVLFWGHYPFPSKENEVLQRLQLKEVIFYSSLDEPFFLYFGGEKKISLMHQMGISENEAIEHPMISAAIRNAQKKISSEIIVEHTAMSQAEWFSKNIVK